MHVRNGSLIDNNLNSHRLLNPINNTINLNTLNNFDAMMGDTSHAGDSLRFNHNFLFGLGGSGTAALGGTVIFGNPSDGPNEIEKIR